MSTTLKNTKLKNLRDRQSRLFTYRLEQSATLANKKKLIPESKSNYIFSKSERIVRNLEEKLSDSTIALEQTDSSTDISTTDNDISTEANISSTIQDESTIESTFDGANSLRNGESETTEGTTKVDTTTKEDPVETPLELKISWQKEIIGFTTEKEKISCLLLETSDENVNKELLKKLTRFEDKFSLNIGKLSSIDEVNYGCISETSHQIFINRIQPNPLSIYLNISLEDIEIIKGLNDSTNVTVSINSKTKISGICVSNPKSITISLESLKNKGTVFTCDKNEVKIQLKYTLCQNQEILCFIYNETEYPYSLYKSDQFMECNSFGPDSSDGIFTKVIIIIAIISLIVFFILLYSFHSLLLVDTPILCKRTTSKKQMKRTQW